VVGIHGIDKRLSGESDAAISYKIPASDSNLTAGFPHESSIKCGNKKRPVLPFCAFIRNLYQNSARTGPGSHLLNPTIAPWLRILTPVAGVL
jgi:hypothetical protein